jgi:hypothetical protein
MRRWMILALLAAGGCSPFTISEDYDNKADFSKYKTWTWFVGPKPSGAGLDSLNENRIRTALEAELPLSGLTKAADAAGADLQVAYHASVSQRIDVTPTTVSFGYGWGHGYVGTSYGADVRTYDQGTLIVDLLDAKTKALAWRGTARATVYRDADPEYRTERIREAVQAILERYPPQR